jgi:hypothetical protein
LASFPLLILHSRVSYLLFSYVWFLRGIMNASLVGNLKKVLFDQTLLIFL